MRKLLLLLLIPMVAVAGPAPLSKQLRIGAIGSGDNNVELPVNNFVALNWMAQHYGYYTSARYPASHSSTTKGLNRAECDYLKTINPNMKITKYDLHARMAYDVGTGFASDTINIMNYASAIGKPIESLLIIANGTVTINNRACPGYTYCGDITTNANGILKYINYHTDQPRIMFDPRSKRYGWYLAHTFDSLCTALNIDGIFGDEYGTVGYTGIPNCDECTMSTMFPLREANYWTAGAGNTKNFPGWSTANIYAYRDSLRKWDTLNWFNALTDSFVVRKGRIYFMNTSANGGSIAGYNSQWQYDVLPMTRLAKSTAQGEYTYQYPGDGSYYDNCRRFLQQMVDVRDFAREMGYMWIRVGQYDQSQQGHSLDRSQMTALGFMLEITSLNKSAVNPYGQTDLFFLPCRQNGQTDFYFSSPITLNGVTIPDTTCLWNDAWGKLFGDATGTLDTTQTGSDATGQAYRIDKAVFYKPGTTDTLTLSVGRIGRLTTSYDSIQTGVNVTLPANGPWYALRSTNHAVKWSTPIAGGSVIKIANAHFQIFSRDTVMSNTGTASAPAATGACCLPDNSCAIVTQASCLSSLGTYNGDNTTCSGNPCGVSAPTGACCLNNVCSITTQASCAGYWQGANTTCNPSYLCGMPSTADTTKKTVVNGQVIFNGQVIVK